MIEIITTPLEIAAIRLSGAIGLVAVLGYIAWRLHKTGSAIESLAQSLSQLVKLRVAEQDEKKEAEALADQAFVNPLSVAIVFDVSEIFAADQASGSWGVALFRVRNVGGESVFLLSIARDAEGGAPLDANGRILLGGDVREMELVLDPDLSPLDEAKVTLWYRDLRGRYWMRGRNAHRAALVEAPAADPVRQITASGTDKQE